MRKSTKNLLEHRDKSNKSLSNRLKVEMNKI